VFVAPSPVLSVAQACELLGCGKTRLFELLADGTLERAPRFGRALRIYRASVERALLPQEKAQAAKKRRAPASSWNLEDVPL
jgi:excisionase family DNA binding protein